MSPEATKLFEAFEGAFGTVEHARTDWIWSEQQKAEAELDKARAALVAYIENLEKVAGQI